MKSNQVIFGNLSNSGKHNSSVVEMILQLTIYSGFSKEDIYNCYVPFVGIVVLLALIIESFLILEVSQSIGQHTLMSDDMSSLAPMQFGYFGLSGPVVLLI